MFRLFSYDIGMAVSDYFPFTPLSLFKTKYFGTGVRFVDAPLLLLGYIYLLTILGNTAKVTCYMKKYCGLTSPVHC